MGFDMTRCPQNELPEALDWFFKGIGRQIGQPAGDRETVMANCGLPPGYGPNIVPDASMPFFAFTQQFSGGPKGRIFLPSNTPDELGYYTRCIQYLDDAAGTYSRKRDPKIDFTKITHQASSTPLVWAWYWVAGNEYSPVVGASGGGTTPVPPTGGGLTEAQVQAMIDKSLEGYVSIADTVALETSNGLYLSFEGGGPTKHGDPVILDWEIGSPRLGVGRTGQGRTRRVVIEYAGFTQSRIITRGVTPMPADRMLQFFQYAHLPVHLQEASKPFRELANKIADEYPQNAERTVTLRKLLEAKDAAVRTLLYKE